VIVAAPLVGAQSTAPDRSPHLLLVPDTAKATVALDKANARTLARYEAFTLVEARGQDEADLRSAGADRRDDMREVSLPGGELDPLRSRSSLAAKGASDPDEALTLVQFAGPVKEAWLDRLRDSGARIVQYVPQNAYVVHARGNEVERLAGLVGTVPAVRAVTWMTGADKRDEGVPAAGASRLVAVQTLAGADGADARRAVTAAGVRARADSNVGGLTTQFVELTGAEVDALAADPAVVAVTPYSMPRLLDERSAQIVAGNLTAGGQPSGPGYLSWLGMQGLAAPLEFAIDVADTGLDGGSTSPGHADFYAEGAMPGTSRVAYVQNGTDDPTASDCSGHGTNVASIAAGFGAGSGSQHQDSSGFKYGVGAAPRAELGVTKIFTCANTLDLPAGGFTSLAAQAYAGGARISNHSWGNQDLGRYSPDSREFDFLVRDARPATGLNEEMVEVFAAGNQGDDRPGAANEGWASIASPGTAKNVITVGASEGVRPLVQLTCGIGDGGADQARDIIDFSSRGPTNDGRLKPDVVAPGTRIVGAAPQTGVQYQGSGVCTKFFEGPFYSLQSGTSQAAPAVSGAAALIRQWFEDDQNSPPSPAMTKAILVGSATDLAGGDNGKGDVIAPAPNADQGWGRAHLGGAFDITERDYFDQDFVLGASGARFARAYDVQDPNKPLKVTLAWTDAPGAVDANPALVNDLDLVVRQGGRTYKGNVFAGGRSTTGGDADRRNNLESVTLPQATGRFSVEVLGTNIAGNGVPGAGDGTDQDFALVVSNAQAQSSPVLAPDEVELAPGGDDDDFLERGEQFDLDVGLRNGGEQNATGVSGLISGSGLSFTQGSAGWPNIAAGAAADSTAPFAGALSADAACGADVSATLALTTDQGPSSLPVTIPTGEPGVPLTSLRSHAPPLAIPDESSVGVTSTISVASPGPVRDVNVTLGGITHDWVGDLVIELTSPQGTTVRLVQHPGGPDNDGNDFVNTTFDDEAATNVSTESAPYTGSFRPQNDQLSRFDGEQRQGTWTLRVRDLFEGDAGTLTSWQTTTRRAICNFADQAPPDTAITAGPSGPVASRSASFSFGASEGDANFECSLDGAPLTECGTPHGVDGLADGTHTLRVQARDGGDNLDPSPAERSWTVDTVAPLVSLATPRAGASSQDARPQLTGSAGTATGDSGNVTVKLWSGTLAAGLPAQILTVSRDAGGAWSTVPAALADGTWTARAEQADAAGNIGVSPSATFSVGSPSVAPTAPDFAIVPAESDLSDARQSRLTLLAGCGSACRVSAELRSRGRRPQLLGRTSTSVGAGRSKAIRVKLTRTGRTRLRGASTYRATLRVMVGGAGQTLAVNRRLVLREIDLRRVARRGLAFTGKCSRSCSIGANLLMKPGEARRHGLRAPGRKPVSVAEATTRRSTSSKFALRLAKSSRSRLSRARRVNVTMEARVSASTGPSHRTSYGLTLRG
jgi:subtilisin-like proprotein convertase family protein